MISFQKVLLLSFFFFCGLSMAQVQGSINYNVHIKDAKGRLIKDAQVEVFTRNVSWIKGGNGDFMLVFDSVEAPIAVSIAYKAKGYKTQNYNYESVPNSILELNIILEKGEDDKAEQKKLEILRATNGKYDKE
ncbi:hypothetical protein [Chryseobacterium polytrichastri]|uniref:Carboxypeptidase regulatory-like domain-containing protein n=1 Tax=Chryseobacterium polytrichastri TaxID=1302687 RepID=A0A1M6RPC0_9FLAO|nr:hypothetical protein [Chryseobacterium polytrichastri]SHK34295.1 hypothetical protein SAMN05444267_100347 [Chryseobacterium polytrichastri]